jgi:hypothetical protein
VTHYSSTVHTTSSGTDLDAKSGGGNTGRARLAVVVGVVLLALGSVFGVGRWLDHDRASGDRGSRPQAFTCGVPSSQPDRDYCRRAAIDDARRAPLTDEQRQHAEGMEKAVLRAASNGGWCMGPMERACLEPPPSHPPGPKDVEAARLWLARTGASDTSARLARPDDPAPVGSLLFAARVEDACIIGHVDAIPGGGGEHHLAGLLPDGRCLAD